MFPTEEDFDRATLYLIKNIETLMMKLFGKITIRYAKNLKNLSNSRKPNY